MSYIPLPTDQDIPSSSDNQYRPINEAGKAYGFGQGFEAGISNLFLNDYQQAGDAWASMGEYLPAGIATLGAGALTGGTSLLAEGLGTGLGALGLSEGVSTAIGSSLAGNLVFNAGSSLADQAQRKVASLPLNPWSDTFKDIGEGTLVGMAGEGAIKAISPLINPLIQGTKSTIVNTSGKILDLFDKTKPIDNGQTVNDILNKSLGNNPNFYNTLEANIDTGNNNLNQFLQKQYPNDLLNAGKFLQNASDAELEFIANPPDNNIVYEPTLFDVQKARNAIPLNEYTNTMKDYIAGDKDNPNVLDATTAELASNKSIATNQAISNNVILTDVDANGKALDGINFNVDNPEDIIDNTTSGIRKNISTSNLAEVQATVDDILKKYTDIEEPRNNKAILDKVASDYNLTKYNYSDIIRQSLNLTPDMLDYLHNPDNLLELIRSAKYKSTDDIANNIIKSYQLASSRIINFARRYGEYGELKGHFGIQNWDKTILKAKGFDNWYNDLVRSGYRAKTEEGIVPLDKEITRSIYNDILNRANIYNFISTSSKPRVLITDIPEGEYAMRMIYMMDRDPATIIDKLIDKGSRNMARLSMFGSNTDRVIAQLGNATGEDVGYLRSQVGYIDNVSSQAVKDIIRRYNKVAIISKATRALLSPYYQLKCLPVDAVGALSLAFAKYGTDVFKGLSRGGFDELKELTSRYGKLPQKDIARIRGAIRDGAFEDNNKFISSIANKVSNINGSHFVDQKVHDLSSFFILLCERENMINGKGIYANIDKDILSKIIPDKTNLPDTDLLRKLANDTNDQVKQDKYEGIANTIDNHILQQINEANPVRGGRFNAKGGVNDLLPIRALSWTANQWYAINRTMIKNIGINLANNNFSQASRILGALTTYGVTSGLVETTLDYLENPDDYKDSNDFIMAFIKNSAISILAGNMYLASMSTFSVGKHLYKSVVDTYKGDYDKAKQQLLKTTNWYPFVNYLTSHI